MTPEPSQFRFPGPHRAADEFVLECDSDVVLGDAVLFTEVVPLDGGGAGVPLRGGF